MKSSRLKCWIAALLMIENKCLLNQILTLLFLVEVCPQPEHLLTGPNQVPDDHLNASSFGAWNGGDFRPTQARLGSPYVNYAGTSMAESYKFGAGIWAPEQADTNQFIQVPI